MFLSVDVDPSVILSGLLFCHYLRGVGISGEIIPLTYFFHILFLVFIGYFIGDVSNSVIIYQ